MSDTTVAGLPATVFKYEGSDCFTMQIDNPNGGLPVETQFGTMSDVNEALAELADVVGLTPEDFYITFAE